VMKKTTLKDIAEESRYNISTVSRALNDSSEISTFAKKRIKKIANRLNYSPNLSAQTLVGKKSKSVGVLLPEVRSDYYGKTANYIETELKKNGYSMLIGLSEFSAESVKTLIDIFISRNVDGILINSPCLQSHYDYIKMLKTRTSTPIIFLDICNNVVDFDNVSIDYTSGIEEAIAYFQQAGCTSVAYVGDVPSSETRLPSFKSAINEHKLNYDKNLIQVRKERFEEAGYNGMTEILKNVRPDAIFASYDDIAIGVLKAIYEHGLRVPEEIMVIGYDNIRVSEHLYNPLSTINPPLRQMATIAVNIFLEKSQSSEGQQIKNVKLKTNLIYRKTTRVL